ncbi:MAG TPA: uracil-DNA glycosylase, partial [Bacteroidota bacterium]
MKEERPAIADLLSDIRGFLARERELFGETLLIDPRLRGDSTMSRSKSEPATPADEPTLFQLPVPATLPITDEAWGNAQSLDGLNDLIRTCVKCPLGHTRTNFVFGTGNPGATLMIIGEAPGADEDAQGEPFVGRAGQLLNKILEAIGFKREDVYICNILKCRP